MEHEPQTQMTPDHPDMQRRRLDALENRIAQVELAGAQAKAQPARYLPVFYPAGQEIRPPVPETHEDPPWRLHSFHFSVMPPRAPNQPPQAGFVCMWQSGGGA